MVEPITDNLAAVRAYQQAAQKLQNPVADANESQEALAPNFSGMVKDVVNQATASVKNAEQMAALGATGQAPLVEVATALSAAEVTLETVVAVRDKVIQAYQEILRMPV